MDWDEPETKKKSLQPKPLDSLGIDELNDYIAQLEAEILRVRQAITAKQAARAGADSFFKR